MIWVEDIMPIQGGFEMWVIVGSNSDRQIQVFGTPADGQPFSSEASAESRAKSWSREFPALDFLVAPIVAIDELPRV
jgi:hypothetical protein